LSFFDCSHNATLYKTIVPTTTKTKKQKKNANHPLTNVNLVFSHITSQAFDFCVFEIDVCEWVVRVFSCHKPSLNTTHPLTNVNLKNTEIKSLAYDMRKHEPPTHKRQSQKHRNQKLGL
jgi:hypothetical protein